MKKLIVACGSGVATSQTVASKLSRLLKERAVPCTVEAVDMKSLTVTGRSDVAVMCTSPGR